MNDLEKVDQILNSKPSVEEMNGLYLDLATSDMPAWVVILVARQLNDLVLSNAYTNEEAGEIIGGEGFSTLTREYLPTLREETNV